MLVDADERSNPAVSMSAMMFVDLIDLCQQLLTINGTSGLATGLPFIVARATYSHHRAYLPYIVFHRKSTRYFVFFGFKRQYSVFPPAVFRTM